MRDSFLIKILLIVFAALLNFNKDVYSQNSVSDFRKEDKLRIREAVHIFNEYGNNIWKNWNSAPFAILLVTNDNEYLMFHQNPSEDFIRTGYDTIIGGDIFTRPRQFSNNFLATFPAVNGVSTIVVGLPENTSRSTTDWIITILHEHFHQLQSTQPDYYESVESLDLAGDDKTGMWMLNYNFPYKDPAVSAQYKILTQSARQTYLTINESDFESNLKSYLSEREKFKTMLNKKDYDYFSFQIWQEGLARYTEIKTAELLQDNYKTSYELAQLDDFVPFDSLYGSMINKLLAKVDSQELNNDERICFYTLGALEGLILDKVNPDWKEMYFREKFYTENYFNQK